MAFSITEQTPPLHKAAVVQMVPALVNVVPNIIPFQYNAEKISHSLTPWDPSQVDQASRGEQNPTTQPHYVNESFDMTLIFDSADGLEKPASLEHLFGVAHRLAAMKRLLLPSAGLIDDLLSSAKALSRAVRGVSADVERPSVPICMLVWGPSRILPVRVASLSIEEQLFSPLLFPMRAQVNVKFQVLTPDTFGTKEKNGKDSLPVRLAKAAYELHSVEQSAMAIANLSNNIDIARAVTGL